MAEGDDTERVAQTRERDARPRDAKARSVKGGSPATRTSRRRRQVRAAFARAERAAQPPAREEESPPSHSERETEREVSDLVTAVPESVTEAESRPTVSPPATLPVTAVTKRVTPRERMSELARQLRGGMSPAQGRTVSTVLKDVGDQPAPLVMRRSAARMIGCQASDLDGLTVLEVQAIVASVKAGSEGEWWDRVHDRLDPKKRRVEHTGADGGAIQAEVTLKREVSDRDASDLYRSLINGGTAAIEDAEVVAPTDGGGAA